jgi:hypothetical protein
MQKWPTILIRKSSLKWFAAKLFKKIPGNQGIGHI